MPQPSPTQHTPGTCQMCESETGNHPSGDVYRREKCGCDVRGVGLLPNPWHVHYCPMHAAAPELLDALERAAYTLRDASDGQPSYFWNKGGDGHAAYLAVRAAIAKAKGDSRGPQSQGRLLVVVAGSADEPGLFHAGGHHSLRVGRSQLVGQSDLCTPQAGWQGVSRLSGRSEPTGEGTGMNRAAAWFGLVICLVAALVAYGGLLVVYHARQEACVREALNKGERVHLSVWEAVKGCQP